MMLFEDWIFLLKKTFGALIKISCNITLFSVGIVIESNFKLSSMSTKKMVGKRFWISGHNNLVTFCNIRDLC